MRVFSESYTNVGWNKGPGPFTESAVGLVRCHVDVDSA